MSELIKLECLGCGASIEMSTNRYYLECGYCRMQFGLPKDMKTNRSSSNEAHTFGSFDTYVSRETYLDTATPLNVKGYHG